MCQHFYELLQPYYFSNQDQAKNTVLLLKLWLFCIRDVRERGVVQLLGRDRVLRLRVVHRERDRRQVPRLDAEPELRHALQHRVLVRARALDRVVRNILNNFALLDRRAAVDRGRLGIRK